MTERRRRMDQAGQILPMVGLMAVILFAIIGLAIDVGRLFVAKAELSRAVDAAALAGVLDLPSLPDASSKVYAYMAENEPSATVAPPTSPGDNQLRVSATKTVRMYFLRVLGIGDVSISANAVAGFGIQPVDAFLAIDATGSMGASPCNGSQNNSGCPIWEAKNAAKSFVDALIGPSPTGYTVVGAGAFRGCFRVNSGATSSAWPMPSSKSNCIPKSMVTDLTSDKTTLVNGINNISALGGSGTNVCQALVKGYQELMPPAPGAHTASNTRRYLVILSDGDNTYNSYSYQGSPNSPLTSPYNCRPNTSPSSSDGNVSSSCYSAQTRERELDVKTLQAANAIKAQNVEIYVVGFGVCGSSSSTVYSASACSSQVGNSDHDDTADRRLLKCIASSTAGTNDHYFEVATAQDLPGVFTTIAQRIAHRLIQ